MSQLNRIIELIRLTNQPGFLLDGDKEPLAVLPLAAYEKLVTNTHQGGEGAEAWSQILQQQIDLWQQQVVTQPKPGAPKVARKNQTPRPDLAEVMEEDIPDEYLPEPLEE